MIGTNDTSDAANVRGISRVEPPEPFKLLTSKGKVYQFLSEINSKGPKKSFQLPINDSMACVANAGIKSGNTIDKNVLV